MLDLVMRFSKKVGAFLPINLNLFIKAVGKKHTNEKPYQINSEI